jgi:hypothetical protein
MVASHLDKAVASAIPRAGEAMLQFAPARSFLESYLEAAFVGALDALRRDIDARLTGRGRIEIPGWDRPLGGFDIQLKLGDTNVVVEAKVDDVPDMLWDALKLASSQRIPEIDGGYLLAACTAGDWARRYDAAGLFDEMPGSRIWHTAWMLSVWQTAWTDLVGPSGGTARPLTVPRRIRTRFIGSAAAQGFDGYEIRCVALEVVDDQDLGFDGDWPVDSPDAARPPRRVSDGEMFDPEVEQALLDRHNRPR